MPSCRCLQAQLKEGTVDKLRQAVPGLTDEHVSIMKRCPMRSFDPMIKQEPHIYRQVAVPAPCMQAFGDACVKCWMRVG